MSTRRQVVAVAPRGLAGLRAGAVIALVGAALTMVAPTVHGETGGPHGLLSILANGNAEFALDLYSRVGSNPGNMVVSPVSISTCLSMAYAGARGQTEEEMAQVLRFALQQDVLHPTFGSLQEKLVAMGYSGELDFSFSNGFWIQEDNDRTIPGYRDLLRECYSAEVQHADFRDNIGQARIDINHWVGEQTHGKLPSVLGPRWERTTPYIVLANAVYFNGRWTHKFPLSRTESAPFFATGGDEVSVEMMRTTASFRYCEDDMVQVIELPYKGHRASMLVVLPREGVGLEPVHEGLTPATLVGWDSALEPRRVSVRLPRFAIGFNLDLTGVLLDMGMRRAFSLQGADFSGMVDIQSEHCLSSVIHGAVIEVDERGTEAAAATIASTTLGLSHPVTPIEFRADRPFLFFVRDRPTGSILFMGKVEKPVSQKGLGVEAQSN